MGKAKGKDIVVIPVYKTSPDATERMSLRQCVKVLGGHDMCFVCPQELDVAAYTELAGRPFRTERFEGRYFQGIEGYNDLLKSRGFYERFASYGYMLIYQLDAWVFEDRLDYWCGKGYDYVGAPWFEGWRNHEEGYGFMCVGNGGFSLRKVDKFLKITNPSQLLYGFWKRLKFGRKSVGEYMETKKDRWEDVFFCYDLKGTRLELKTPSCRKASMFSIETSPEYIFKEVNRGQLPFGCHAWKRYQYEEFWSKHIIDNV